jgi:hypothetical protein
MNSGSRQRPAEPFRYSDEQWARMQAIVERAGGDAARDKFDAQRVAFESIAHGWKRQMGKWNGFVFRDDKHGDNSDRFERIATAARELKAGLEEFASPAFFWGHDLLWKRLDGTETDWEAEKDENWQRYRKFLGALSHLQMRGAELAAQGKPLRKRVRFARNLFIGHLGEYWRTQLGLHITASVKSPFVRFVEAAAEGVYKFKSPDAARDKILNVVRGWGRPVCKNRGKES